MAKYFLFDCETGGTNPDKFSLLSVYGVIIDKNLEILDSLDLIIKPNPGEAYRINPEAMEVNQIDLMEHNDSKMALTESEAAIKFESFVTKWFLDNQNKKIVPAGHCNHFDKEFLKKLIGFEKWDKYFSNKMLDTASIGRFLFLNGTYSEDPSNLRFDEFLNFFKIKTDEPLHNAKVDTLATLSVLKKMIKGDK